MQGIVDLVLKECV